MRPEAIMRLALEEAEISVKEGNAPFAVVVTDQNGKVILKEHDRVKEYLDPTAHGEINAIRILCRKFNTLSLKNFIFYTTSEPCPTCFSSMVKAKVSKAYFGAKTETTASLPIPVSLLASSAKKYPIEISGGLLEKECLEQRERLVGI